MRRIVLFILLVSCVVSVSAQGLFSYQAVVRDNSNHLIVNQVIGMQITILQYAEDGGSVYVETHTPVSNANGLISVSIGAGTVVSGDLPDIDWSDGPYFVKTEIDTEGGISYSIEAVSQLLAVPYAMHALSADNVYISGNEDVFDSWDKDYSDDFSGDYNDLENQPLIPTNMSDLNNDTGYLTEFEEQDGDSENEIQDLQLDGNELSITGNTSANIIDLSTYLDNTNLTEQQVDVMVENNGYLSVEQDGSVTNELEMPQNPAIGTMCYYNGTEWVAVPAAQSEGAILTFVDGAPAWMSPGQTVELEIGDYAHGGIVVYILQPVDPGYVEGEQHGLVVSLEDVMMPTTWGFIGVDVPGCDLGSLGGGIQNTMDIINFGGAEGTPAEACFNYTGGGYDDWFLPSVNEANVLGDALDLINAALLGQGGNVISANYWTSTEQGVSPASSAFYFCTPMLVSTTGNKTNNLKVRAMRSF